MVLGLAALDIATPPGLGRDSTRPMGNSTPRGSGKAVTDNGTRAALVGVLRPTDDSAPDLLKNLSPFGAFARLPLPWPFGCDWISDSTITCVPKIELRL
jgi:hypothetical protein